MKAQNAQMRPGDGDQDMSENNERPYPWMGGDSDEEDDEHSDPDNLYTWVSYYSP